MRTDNQVFTQPHSTKRHAHLISHHLHTQLLRRHHANRFVEVSRTLVFTSARKDTNAMSNRLRMFRDMEGANYEVHMTTTEGHQEKCVDISLAVEMMQVQDEGDSCPGSSSDRESEEGV